MSIEISIIAGRNAETSGISATGTTEHIITDAEKKFFGLDDKALKNAVETYFDKKPTDAYLHSATPWGDLYKKYQWPEVKTILTVQSATIREITTKPQQINEQVFTNNSKQTATFDAGISEQVSNTIESNWSQTDTLEVSQSINYGVTFPGGSVGGTTTFSYSHTFGQGGAETQTVTVGSSSGVNVTLDPKESVRAVLSASLGTMKVRVVYTVYLTGCIAINYEHPYKDHHFHALDIQAVMEKAGLPGSIQYTEDIEIQYFSKAK